MSKEFIERHPDMVTRTIGDEMILVPIRGSITDLQNLFILNETALFIWEQLDEPRSLEQLSAALEEWFTVSAKQARQDVGAFVEELLSAGCVTERTDAADAR